MTHKLTKPAAFLAETPLLNYRDFERVAIVSDTLAVVAATLMSNDIYHRFAYGRDFLLTEYVGVGAILAALTVALTKLNGWCAPDRLVAIRPQVIPIITIWSSTLLFFLFASFTLKISASLSRGSILSLAITGPVMILGQRYLLGRAMSLAVQSGWLRRQKILLITGGDPAHSTSAMLAVRPTHNVVRTLVLPHKGEATEPILASAAKELHRSHVDEIHIAIGFDRWSDLEVIISALRAVPLPVRLIADARVSQILQYPEERLCGAISFEIQRAPLTHRERIAKRTLDIVGASIALIMLAPLMAVVALLVRVESPGPIFFAQARGGFNGRAFRILKFRTMRVMENGPVVRQASRNDPRVTRVGRWLRRSSIDELPQLINVLRGDMSLVGPRPHALAHDDEYASVIEDYFSRHHMKPGITGWAQINGFRGETPTVELMTRRVELDVWYVANWNFWLDLRILFGTVLELCRPRNAF